MHRQIKTGWPPHEGLFWYCLDGEGVTHRRSADARLVRVTLNIIDCETGEDITEDNRQHDAVSRFLWACPPGSMDDECMKAIFDFPGGMTKKEDA